MAVAQANNDFWSCCKSGDISNIKEMWNGPKKVLQNIEVADHEGKNGLIHAAMNNHREVLDYLLTENLDINYRDNDGRTALHHASNKDFKSLIIFLLMNGADPGIKDKAKDPEGKEIEGKVPGAESGKMRNFINDVSWRHLSADLRGEPVLREAD